MKSLSLSLGCCFLAMPQFLLAEDAPIPPQQGFMQTVTLILVALVFFYFILWRPEQKRRKIMDEQRNALKKGDRVTAVGIIGTVVKVEEQTVIVRMYDGSKIEFLKAAITDVIPGSAEEEKREEKREG